MITNLQEKFAVLLEKICHFERSYGRAPGSVRLIAVSKTRPASVVQETYQAGQRDFAENYLQEAIAKQAALADLPLTWHFIGPIQSNKTKPIALHFDWVHSIDRLKIARRLSEQRPDDAPDLKVLIQVNPDNEPGKAGVARSELKALAEEVDRLPRLQLCGLMAIPAPRSEIAEQRSIFRKVRMMAMELQDNGLEHCTELSMGMTNDYEAAIAEGATMIRIGSALFGPRD